MGGQSSRLISPHTLPLHVQYPARRNLVFLGAGNEAAVQNSRSRYIQAGLSSKPGPHIYYGMGLCTFNSFAVYARLPRYLRKSPFYPVTLCPIRLGLKSSYLAGPGSPLSFGGAATERYRTWCYKVL